MKITWVTNTKHNRGIAYSTGPSCQRTGRAATWIEQDAIYSQGQGLVCEFIQGKSSSR